MGVLTLPAARRLLRVAEAISGEDPVAAYLCAWAAFDHAVGVLAARAGVRAQFGLRKNGTLRTHTVGGAKMPEVSLPAPEQQRAAALHALTLEARDRLIRHPAAAALAHRVPTLNGRLVAYDSRKQRLTGVLDVPATLDPRFPVWAPIDGAALRAWTGGVRDAAKRDDLVGQIVAVLETIHRDLRLAAGPDEGEANVDLAKSALPLLVLLVEALLEGS